MATKKEQLYISNPAPRKYRGSHPRRIKAVEQAGDGVYVVTNDDRNFYVPFKGLNGYTPRQGEDFPLAIELALSDSRFTKRRINPSKRAVKRPSQITKKAPTKRLVARRKKAAAKPVKGYFPNPGKKPAPYNALPYCVQLEYEGRGWKTVAAFAAQIPAENHAHGIAKKFPDGPSIRVIKK